MRKFLATLLAAFGVGSSAATPAAAPDNPASDLRSMALHIAPDQIGLTPQNFPHKVWGIVMETGIDSGFYTLVVLGDGTTSLYFSTGGGIIGAGEHASVRSVSGQLLDLSNSFQDQAASTSSFPPPVAGETTFYFLTFDGPRSYTAKEQALGERRDKLSELFHASHAVIAAIRNTQQ